jgi:hypothetical protein
MTTEVANIRVTFLNNADMDCEEQRTVIVKDNAFWVKWQTKFNGNSLTSYHRLGNDLECLRDLRRRLEASGNKFVVVMTENAVAAMKALAANV